MVLVTSELDQRESTSETVHLSACEDEEGRPQQVEIPLQRRYIGPRAIPESMASVPCATLGESALLKELNSIFGTSKTDYGLVKMIWQCIDLKYDFGTAYSYLYRRWDNRHWWDNPVYVGNDDSDKRKRALDHNGDISNPGMNPRRIWDLFANRVVPYWFACAPNYPLPFNLTPISHAWTEKDRRHSIQTSINGYEWPVPIPKDTTLERIRMELLNYGFQYAWIDVLCLRQEGSVEKDSLRLEEWRLDVATIGAVYREHGAKFSFCYFSGLGRPFKIEGLSSSRHWLNRAWTLQETQAINISGGITDNALTQHRGEEPSAINEFYDRLTQLQLTLPFRPDPCQVLNMVPHRMAESELDKIFGVVYLLGITVIPTYILGQDPEEAWERIVKAVSPAIRGELLFRSPAVGDGRAKWCPSWRQVQQGTLLDLPDRAYFAGFLDECDLTWNVYQKVYLHEGWCIDVRILDTTERTLEYRGEYGRPSTCAFLLHSSTAIPPGPYTLSACSRLGNPFVVGCMNAQGRLEKAGLIDCDFLAYNRWFWEEKTIKYV